MLCESVTNRLTYCVKLYSVRCDDLVSKSLSLVMCHKRRLNQGSFCFAVFHVFAFLSLIYVCYIIFNLSTVLYFSEHPT